MKKCCSATMLFSLGVGTLLVNGHGTRAQDAEKKVAPTRTSSGQKQSVQAATLEPNYIIGPDDVLDISVWNEPNHSRTVPVRPDGKISLPLLNDIQAVGLTPMQLSASITDLLKKYVSQPQVTVIVTQINSQRVYVLGEVGRPGPLSLLPDMSVLQALSTAGGLNQFANQKGIYVLRSENGKQRRYPFNYRLAIRGSPTSQNITLKPGDTIVVP